MEGTSLDLKADLIARLKEIVPGAFKENTLDYQQLQRLLGDDDAPDSAAHYQLNWAGKKAAYRELQNTTTQTLAPDVESSINWETAYHVFIEGDNLDVLKTLQKAYYGRVKMIYIDPPYNTGNDSFLYQDTFKEAKEGYLDRTRQTDESRLLQKAQLFKRNTRESGRFHSNWLNMMLPRLFLARNLLTDDGVIFVSIDDNEQATLKLLLDEVFGEENFIANMIRENKAGAGHDTNSIAIEYDYTLLYAKNKSKLVLNKAPIDVENDPKYKLSDAHIATRGKYYLRDLDYRGTYSPSGDYEIQLPGGKTLLPGGKYGPPNTWRWSKEKVAWGLENDFVVLDAAKEKVYIKQYQFVDNSGQPYARSIPFRALTKFMNGKGSQEVEALLGPGMFSFPKSTEMIQYFLSMVVKEKDALIMDFFAGSGTTGHAVMDYNRKHDTQLSSISVQLPEVVAETAEAYQRGFRTIAQVSFERLKKVVQNQNADGAEKPVGIRKFCLRDSHFRVWQGAHSQTEMDLRQALEEMSQSVLSQETADDYALTWELLLKNGVGLLANVTVESTAAGSRFFWLEKERLAILTAPFDETLLHAFRALQPQSILCLDACFQGQDAAKTNFLAQMRAQNTSVQVV